MSDRLRQDIKPNVILVEPLRKGLDGAFIEDGVSTYP